MVNDDKPTQDVHLDEGELFTQLCTVTNVVKEGPRHGLFISHVNVSDGVVRVWRDWLARHASKNPSDGSGSPRNEEDILWADPGKNVGLRFRVVPGPAERMPLLTGPGDDAPVSYVLEYEGEHVHVLASDAVSRLTALVSTELLVRSTELLLAVEKSEVHDVAFSSTAIIISGI